MQELLFLIFHPKHLPVKCINIKKKSTQGCALDKLLQSQWIYSFFLHLSVMPVVLIYRWMQPSNQCPLSPTVNSAFVTKFTYSGSNLILESNIMPSVLAPFRGMQKTTQLPVRESKAKEGKLFFFSKHPFWCSSQQEKPCCSLLLPNKNNVCYVHDFIPYDKTMDALH